MLWRKTCDFLSYISPMLCFPNAKINIGLNVVSKRLDGFHNIETIFYPIKWADVLEIVPETQNKESSFIPTGDAIPGSTANNLCLKAYSLLSIDFELPPVQIYLHKIIPTGAGLGGGSSDAAYTIKTLNSLFKLGLTVVQMQDYARKLGSDCAFFIENRPVYAFEKGDVFEDVQLDLSSYTIALVKPAIHVSTATAYAGVVPNQPQSTLKEMIQQPIQEWKSNIFNDFERSVFKQYPQIAAIKEALYQQGALYASMSGSGSTVYGIFNKKVALSFPDCKIFI